jgi:uncharacterized protein YuzE
LTLPWWREAVSIAVRVEPVHGTPSDVEYRWDTDTDILTIMMGGSDNGLAAIEMNTAIAAEADDAERTIHFRLGPSRQTKTVRIAREILIDVDGKDRIAGVWLLDVPPFPEAQ